MRSFALLTLVVVLVASCGRTSLQRIGGTYPPRPEDWPIEVYLADSAPVDLIEAFPDAKQPPPQHELIGIGQADPDVLTTWSHVKGMAAEQARAVGGDGIMIRGYVREYTGTNPTLTYEIMRWK